MTEFGSDVDSTDNLIGVIAVATYIYRRGAISSITSPISITRELPIGSE